MGVNYYLNLGAVGFNIGGGYRGRRGGWKSVGKGLECYWRMGD